VVFQLSRNVSYNDLVASLMANLSDVPREDVDHTVSSIKAKFHYAI